jgi:hypothetical protein
MIRAKLIRHDGSVFLTGTLTMGVEDGLSKASIDLHKTERDLIAPVLKLQLEFDPPIREVAGAPSREREELAKAIREAAGEVADRILQGR